MIVAPIAIISSAKTFNIHLGLEEQLQVGSLALSLEAIRLSKETPTIIAKIPLDLRDEVTKEAILKNIVTVQDLNARELLAKMILNQLSIFQKYLEDIHSPHTIFTYKLGVIKDSASTTPSNLRLDEDKIAGSFPISIAQLHGVSLENYLEDGRLASTGQGFLYIQSTVIAPPCNLITAKCRENATFVGVIQASYPSTPLSADAFTSSKKVE